jgi:hypothetical protein
MKVEIEGVTLHVTQHENFVTVTKVVGRDRKKKVDIKSGRQFRMPVLASEFIDRLKKVSKLKVARCVCGYGRGWSGHADHCESIYVASCEDYYPDD